MTRLEPVGNEDTELDTASASRLLLKALTTDVSSQTFNAATAAGILVKPFFTILSGRKDREYETVDNAVAVDIVVA